MVVVHFVHNRRQGIYDLLMYLYMGSKRQPTCIMPMIRNLTLAVWLYVRLAQCIHYMYMWFVFWMHMYMYIHVIESHVYKSYMYNPIQTYMYLY